MLAAGLYRYFGIRKCQKIDITDDYAAALKAERYYLIGGAIQGFFLGLFCFVAIYWTPDVYGEIASVLGCDGLDRHHRRPQLRLQGNGCRSCP